MPFKSLPKGQACFNSYFGDYKRSANERGFTFALSKEQFKSITSSECHYCGEPPRLIKKKNKNFNGSYIGNGIDRINNKIGYTIENCVSCCKYCNYAKHKMTYAEFLNKINNIHDNFIKRNGRTRTLYACGVDFQHEICEAPDLEGKMPLYSSIKRLKEARSCWDECGIMKLELKFSRWVHPQDLFKNIKKKVDKKPKE